MNPPKNIGRYEIIEEIGHGAMGSVFRATDPAMGRVVAIKTILTAALASEQAEEFLTRFQREARAAGALAHPGIVPVFDVGEHDGAPFLVMEFVNGQTLADAMKKGDRLTLERVCEIGQQIAEALGYAHRKGVVHRDIKPANILLTSQEAYGNERPRITDFGVAKLTAGEVTTTGQLLGTPAFMPPEQFTGAPIDGRTDLFSLGVILYQMATGEQPFPGETMTTVSYKVVHVDPIPPSKLNPAISAAMEGVILKCLAKSPAERYQTGEELARDLDAVRTGAVTPAMQTMAPQAMTAGDESEETIDATPSLKSQLDSVSSASSSAPQAAMPSEAEPAGKGTMLAFAVVVVLAAALGVGSWFALLHRGQAPVPKAAAQAGAQQPSSLSMQGNQTAPSGTAAPAAVQTDTAEGASQQDATGSPAAKTTASVAAKPPAAFAAPPHIASVNFNPKTLDSNKNERLKIDLNHFDPAFTFSIDMDSLVYFKGKAGEKSAYSTLLVPPGEHKFRVTVTGGSVQKTSNVVSAKFVAGKKITLKVQLEPSPKGSPAVLDPATKVVANLKSGFLFF